MSFFKILLLVIHLFKLSSLMFVCLFRPAVEGTSEQENTLNQILVEMDGE